MTSKLAAALLSSLLLAAGLSCGGDGTEGPQGPEGPKGDPGDPGSPGDPAARVVSRAFFAVEDTAASGLVRNRKLTVAKKSAGTHLRVTYYDNLAAWTGGGGKPACACRWELLFGGEPCSSPGPIIADVASIAGEELRPTTVTGWCKEAAGEELGAQPVTITVKVGTAPGMPACSCRTGYGPVTGVLEAEEIQ